jgi:glutathione synthase/RimK-type ligase-like ATP-grasp enzyme
MGYQVADEVPQELHQTALREIQSAIGCFYRMAQHAKWVNSIHSIEDHLYKGYQLQLLSRVGIRIPKTLISNQPEDVKAFFDDCNGEVVFKPVAGGAHAQALTKQDLTPQRLSALAKSPVQFQERIYGVDIRAYAIGNELYAAEIQANSLDFRDDPNAPIIKTTLPDPIAQSCNDLIKVLGYQYSGIDIKRTPDGEFIFLEGNPCPMFYHFEKITGFPITEALIKLLI